MDGDPLDAEFGPGDLLLHGDQALPDLGGGGVHHGRGLTADGLQPHPRCGEVVGAFGVADVLDRHAVADTAHYAFAVRGVRHPARQFTDVHGAGAFFRKRQRAHPLQQFRDRRRVVQHLAGRDRVALLDGVANAQLDRVHAQRGGEFVHLGLIRESRLYRAKPAHRAARRVVGVEAPALDVHVRHGVGAGAEGGAVADHHRRLRGVGAAVEVLPRLDVDEFPVASRAVLVVHLGRMPMHVAVERLLAVVNHLHWFAQVQREHAHVDLDGQVLPAAERAADAGHGHPHLLRRQPERPRGLLAVGVQVLGRQVQVDPAVLGGDGQPGLGPQERLILHPDGVNAGHHDLGGGLRIALDDLLVAHHVAARVQLRQRVVVRGPLRVDDRLQYLVVDDDALQRPPRGLRVVGGDQRDRLALVAHHADGQHRLVGELQAVAVLARHVLGGQHGLHPGHRHCRADVDRLDPRVRVRAAQRRPPQHVLGPQIRGVGELSAHLDRTVRAQRGFADAAADGVVELLRTASRCVAVHRTTSSALRDSRTRSAFLSEERGFWLMTPPECGSGRSPGGVRR